MLFREFFFSKRILLKASIIKIIKAKKIVDPDDGLIRDCAITNISFKEFYKERKGGTKVNQLKR